MDRITTPGKFQGEPAYVPYYWEQDDEDDSWIDVNGYQIRVWNLTDDDRLEWPDLGVAVVLVLWETDQGFVYSRTFDTVAAYVATYEEE